jgi:hypothetical protein
LFDAQLGGGKVIPFRGATAHQESGKLKNEAVDGIGIKPITGVAGSMSGKLKNEAVDVIKRALELSDTIIEAIDYLMFRLSADDYEQGMAMLPAIGEGLESMKNTKRVILNEDIMDLDIGEKCTANFSDVASAFEDTVNAAIDGGMEEFRRRSADMKTTYIVWHEAISINLRSLSVM